MKVFQYLQLYLSLFLLAGGFLLSSCTGGGSASAKKPIDTEPIWGVRDKTFYNALSATSANVLLVPAEGVSSVLEHLEGRAITSKTSISTDSVQISADGAIATIKGQPGIYQLSQVEVSSIANGTAELPTPTIEAYCNGFTLNGYNEFLVQLVGGTYSFVANGSSGKSTIGSASAILKNSGSPIVSFDQAGFGSVQVNTSSPSPTDSTFFAATFNLTVSSPWQSLSLFCHLNNVDILPPRPSGWTSMTPPDSSVFISNTSGTGTTAIWAGSKMVVFGVVSGSNSGGMYEPLTDSWEPIAIPGIASNPNSNRTALWTGSKVIVWQGYNGPGNPTGFIYDPVAHSATPITDVGAPQTISGRTGSAVWTGSKMIVWGGDSGGGNFLSTGAIYDPQTNTWTPTNPNGAPPGTDGHYVFWTGSKMIVWGGHRCFWPRVRHCK